MSRVGIRNKKKNNKAKKKKVSDMFVLDILLPCVAIQALFISFIIEGLCEFSMRMFPLLEPLSLCSWRDESFREILVY